MKQGTPLTKNLMVMYGYSGKIHWAFMGFISRLHFSGPLQESAVWIDESQTVYAQLGRGRTTSPLISKDDEDPLGISDEGNRAKSEGEMQKMFPDGR